eukprot:6208306-Pleurochrysis_carterae.AAC.1
MNSFSANARAIIYLSAQFGNHDYFWLAFSPQAPLANQLLGQSKNTKGPFEFSPPRTARPLVCCSL